MSDSRNRRHLGTHHLWNLGSASCVSVGCSKGEQLERFYLLTVSKTYFQSIEMLLSSAGSEYFKHAEIRKF